MDHLFYALTLVNKKGGGGREILSMINVHDETDMELYMNKKIKW